MIRRFNLIAVLATASLIGCANQQRHMRERFRRIKESTVRIWVNEKPSGTGFAIGPNLVVTNYHVVEKLTPTTDGKSSASFSESIQVQDSSGRMTKAVPHTDSLGANLAAAIGQDIVVLAVPAGGLVPFKLGRFEEAQPGDEIYLTGYPFGIDEAIVAKGFISTKFKTGSYLNAAGPREVAWLDLTMNRGNSGGPVVRLGRNPASDSIVCVSNFNLNPFAKPAEKMSAVVESFPGNAIIVGIDFKESFGLIGQALAAQSHGVGGCVSADYVPRKK